jgi:hypothetical protein
VSYKNQIFLSEKTEADKICPAGRQKVLKISLGAKIQKAMLNI